MIVQHFGLTFSPTDAAQARDRRAAPELANAWAAFDALRANPAVDPVQKAVIDAVSWRLTGDSAAAEQAAAALTSGVGKVDDSDLSLVDGCRIAIGLAQAFECVRDHPSLSDAQRASFIDGWYDRVARLNDLRVKPESHEQTWLAAVNLAAGVILEREPVFATGADMVRRIVDVVQPHGYISAIVEPRDETTLQHTVQAVHGLVLAAEIASHAGVDLWAYERRGVSVMTAALYPLYYYYYPEKWPWYEGLEPEPVKAEFRRHAAFLEVINRRSGGTVRAVKLILDDVRPVFDALGGGPVSLTHAIAPVVRRGLFRR
jgi:hypothetical protein